METYIGLKDTRTTDHAMRKHRKKTGRLERRQGAHLRDGLMQGILKRRVLLATDTADAAELGIRSHDKVKPRNGHVTQKQRVDVVAQEGKAFNEAIGCMTRQGKELMEYLAAKKENTDMHLLLEEVQLGRKEQHKMNERIDGLAHKLEALIRVSWARENGRE